MFRPDTPSVRGSNRPRQPSESRRPSLLWRSLRRGDAPFATGVPSRFLSYLLYLAFLGIIYIANGHYSDRVARQITRTEATVEDLRVDYTTLKAAYMYGSKQSEVARRVQPLGLQESLQPPYKIELTE